MKRPLLSLSLALGAIGQAHADAPSSRPIIDPAKVIEALDVCRAAPQGREQTLDFARSKGFRDLPVEEQRRFPMPQYIPLERDGVWLRATDKVLTGWAKSGGSCEVLAPVPAGTTRQQVDAALEQKFGLAPVITKYQNEENRSWKIDGRSFSARIIGRDLNLYMSFPEPFAGEYAAAQEAEEKAKAERIAALKAATVFSPAADFGKAAVACLAVLGKGGLDVAALEREGWTIAKQTKSIPIYQRNGSAVQVMLVEGLMPGGQCIVDGYASDSSQFKPIRDGVRDALTARLGQKPKMPGSPLPNGQGFVAGDLMLILSTEERVNGLSVRITSARIGGM